MLDRLPIYIDPIRLSERGKQLSGTVELNDFPRLAGLLLDTLGKVDVDLSFDKEGRLAIVSGKIRTNLKLECQSCLQPIDWVVDHRFKLGVVSSLEHADKLSSDVEPLIFNGEKIAINGLIEDEMLLVLPDFPRHEHVCIEVNDSFSNIEKDDKQLDSNNPFSVLAKLKNTGE